MHAPGARLVRTSPQGDAYDVVRVEGINNLGPDLGFETVVAPWEEFGPRYSVADEALLDYEREDEPSEYAQTMDALRARLDAVEVVA